MGRTASIKTAQVDGEEEVGAKASGSQTLLRGLDVIDALIDGALPLTPGTPALNQFPRGSEKSSAIYFPVLLLLPPPPLLKR